MGKEDHRSSLSLHKEHSIIFVQKYIYFFNHQNIFFKRAIFKQIIR